MAGPSPPNPAASPPAPGWWDVIVTLLCWCWFLFGFLCIFSWGYGAALCARQREYAFQRLNSRFFQVLFWLLRHLAPAHRWESDAAVAGIRSSVLVCNHLSYLDPLLFIALFGRQRTMVKPRFFSMPVFGGIMRNSGYLPASASGRHGRLLLQGMDSMERFLADGGNLFVFPEGTRSRDGQLGGLQQGALKIARLYRAPIQVLRLSGTDRLFPPGSFWFNTTTSNTIRLQLVERIDPAEEGHGAAGLAQRLRQAFAQGAT